MSECVVGEHFEFVCGPVAEVEWSGGAGFEGVAAFTYVVEVEDGASFYKGFHRGEVAVDDFGCVSVEPIEEG